MTEARSQDVANDLHGPYLGRDGWIYWCKGAFAEQTHKLADNKKLTSSAAHLLRRRPEGGPVEISMSGGMDNPVEMAFLPNGDKFFTSTFLQYPAEGKRDGIGHAVYGSLFGKRHRPIEGHFRTGDLMPVTKHLGPAAPSGLAYLHQWSENHSTLACAQFNLHKVSIHELVPDGAAFKTIDHDLVRSDHLPFHPTDVIEDADGSLIILDTGDWYDLCCPSSGAENSTEVGGIYRLRKDNASPMDDAIGKQLQFSQLPISQLIELLDDRRHFVRENASSKIDLSKPSHLKAIRSLIANRKMTSRTATELVWVFTRQINDDARLLLQQMLSLPFEGNELHQHQTTVLNALAISGVSDLSQIVRLLSGSSSASVRRAAAECVGRWGKPDRSTDLLQALEFQPLDRTLQHSIIYALYELGSTETLSFALTPNRITNHPRQAYASLMVLSQTTPSTLNPTDVLEAADSPNEALHQLAFETMTANPGWSKTLAPKIQTRWVESNGDTETLIDLIAAWHDQPEVAAWLPHAIGGADIERTIRLVEAIEANQVPASWDESLANLLQQCNSVQQEQLFERLSRFRITYSHTQTLDFLISLCTDESIPVNHRLAGASAIPNSVDPKEHGVSRLVSDSLIGGNEKSKSIAAHAAQSLLLDDSTAMDLIEQLDAIETRHFASVVESIVRSSEENAARLLDRLRDLPAAKTLSTDFLSGLYKSFDGPTKKRARELVQQLSAPEENVAKALDQLVKELPPGDDVRGMEVFRSSKAACTACHRIGSVGGFVGPTLTGIGNSRSRRDLIQAIVFPNSHIAQGYSSTRILTVDGHVLTGIIKRETSDRLDLYVAVGKEQTIMKDEIELREESDVSIMPAGLDGVLTKQDLSDLVELLGTFRVRR